MSLTASATSCSNRARVMLRLQRAIVIAILADRALVAERLGPADAAAVQNLDVGRQRPHPGWKRCGELPLHLLRIVTRGDADTVRHAEHVAIDGKPGHAQRV